MAFLDEKQGFMWMGIALGASAMLLARALRVPLAEAARALTKSTLKLSLDAAERAREGAMHLREVFEDMLAEIHAEREARDEERRREAKERWADDVEPQGREA